MSDQVNPLAINSLALAYMGDAIMEYYVRQELIISGRVKPQQLHHKAISYVSAKAQAAYLRYLMEQDFFSTEELQVIKRGRNAKSYSIPKNTDVLTYHYSTAFEALIGYLHFNDQGNRIEQLMRLLFEYHPIDR
ncbi:Mini-ribonuclease 3 [Terrilactibacillus laevilacticus]|uniref:Mini-ribonuclease 3 n=1 Tax=Terrilactibacillus laevilacticus TaxID=1380157 RepID=A0ABW5PR99_9BACI|nr:ribonuclease III domain-containing protein [Terrilactibacillus laevilacticus]